MDLTSSGSARSIKKVRWGTAPFIIGAGILTLSATIALCSVFICGRDVPLIWHVFLS